MVRTILKNATIAFAGLILAIGQAYGRAPTDDPFLSAVRVADRRASVIVSDGDLGSQPQRVIQTSGYRPSAYAESPCVTPYVDGVPYGADSPYLGPIVTDPMGYGTPSNVWGWEVMPDGLIYRSYQAGPRESRLALHAINNSYPGQRGESAWDATLGGRKGILRFGNGDPTNPIGWQLDIEGAAFVRLNIDENRDVDSSDFRFGVPLTYTSGNGLAYKVGYYHVSSHLGDELIARTGVNDRINYVRDAVIAGVSYQATPTLRVYGETAVAFFTAGGAEPWEFQFGAEYSQPGPTGFAGTPFVATNAHLREELDFSGDWTLQTGWLWRGETGSTTRLGLHYLNGKSSQYQFNTRNEEQIGFGIWCDF